MEVAGCKLRFHQSPPTTLQNATRNPVAFLFYWGAFPPPFGALATQLYIVYYFFIFYFIYKVHVHARAHAQGGCNQSCGLRVARWQTEKGATARNFATATAQPCNSHRNENSPQSKRSLTEYFNPHTLSLRA